ncbi:MAG TPA: SRPBCC domain-containing protein [Pseudonocardiaceae bacterium]|nr:SRPBCC domain-containing protein [Pseudonocardiaceae bacterium]
MNDNNNRVIDLSVEVVGAPEQVWAAIATGPGISAWLQPTEVEPRVGGRFAFDMSHLGGGRNESGQVTAWEPPQRFATGGVRWEVGGRTAVLATEWLIETANADTCVVRIVMSGFGSDAAWDNEIDGLTEGMRLALEHLRQHLAAALPTR